jgi:ubiquinone/menaquinone biosynthesis C-methylase UbiE
MVWSRIFLLFLLLPAVMGSGCVSLKRLAYEGFGRDRWQHAEEVVHALQIQAGAHVADLGSGSGFFTFRLADAVGRDGKVYAVDVDPQMNEYLMKRITEEGYKNIEVTFAAPSDPKLQESSVDLIFTCNTYHHLSERVTYFAYAKRYLRPGGRIAVIDFSGKGLFHKLFGHYAPRDLILSEMADAGYELDQELFFLPRQTFLVFKPKGVS